jgi:hypothetical protein
LYIGEKLQTDKFINPLRINLLGIHLLVTAWHGICDAY